MSITDELRRHICELKETSWYNPNSEMNVELEAEKLSDIADHIEAELEKALTEQHDTPAADIKSMSDEEMAEHGLAKLPVDADGAPIHVGDEVEESDTRVIGRAHGEVVRVVFSKRGASVRVDTGLSYADLNPWNVRHSCHTPTIEDTLREFVDEFNRDDTELCDDEIIERFADRIKEMTTNKA